MTATQGQQPAAPKESGGSGGLWLWWLSFVFPAGLSVWLVVNGLSATPISTNSALGVIGLVVVWALFLVFFLVHKALRHGTSSHTEQRLTEVVQRVEHLASLGALSDDARRVLNRAREREMLRRAIEEDIARQDWEAAMVLVKELADRFGYRADAEEFRHRIETHRSETQDKKVRDAIGMLDGLIIQRRWDAAYEEAAKIGRLYPDSHRVEGLRNRVEQAREMYKAELIRRFEAERESDAEEALELLKELDQYLTEAEAAPYREMARGVIGKARDNLGSLFKVYVQDRKWAEAVQVGDQIMSQFPNTRMAAEVRSVIDGLRTKAAAMAG